MVKIPKMFELPPPSGALEDAVNFLSKKSMPFAGSILLLGGFQLSK